MMKKFSLLFSIALIVSLGCDTGEVAQSVDATPAVTSTEEHAAVEFTSAGFEAEVLNSSQVVLVDCWAPW